MDRITAVPIVSSCIGLSAGIGISAVRPGAG